MPRDPHASGQSESDSIGARIRARRLTRKNWSIRYIADRAGLDNSYLSRVERGERAINNRFVLNRLAAALECSVADLTGQPYVPADQELETAHRWVHSTRHSLLSLDLAEPAEAGPTRHIDQVAAEADLIAALRRSCDYAGITSRLPALLDELYAHATRGGETERALSLLIGVGNAAAYTLSRLGYPGDGYVAARIGHEAGQHLGDPVSRGVADFALAHAVGGGGGAYRRMLTIADRATGRLSAVKDTPDSLETRGMLTLTAATGHLGVGDVTRARDALAEAKQIAGVTGERGGWSHFGPTNASFWEVALEVDMGNPGRAVEIARTVQPSAVDSPSRQVAFHLDVARALTSLRGRHHEATRQLLTAERLAPQRTRSAPHARETARELAETAKKAAVGPDLRGFCERAGVAV
ncbi:helix-turn-helix domain-containing protein [Cryptosporangium sp. NPDC051539]|uniref:helix-turn-helix domain-containing protein n=1 Tax=Cryptosporangium sp. NPDC051539 TaxID=3363962 RepID=UPI00379E8EBD